MTEELSLVTTLEEMQLAPKESKTLLDGFGELFVEAHKLVTQGKAIKVTSEDQVEEMAQAKTIRIQLMKIRKEAEKIKIEIKEPYLRGAKASQQIFNDIRDITKPEEDRLKEQEKFAELAEAKRVEERHTKRVEKLSLYVEDVSVYSLKEMPDSTYQHLLEECKKVYDDKVDAEKRMEVERVEKEVKQELYNERKMTLAPLSDFIGGGELDINTNQTEYEEIIALAQNNKKTYDENQAKIEAENERLKKEADEKDALEAKRLTEETRLEKNKLEKEAKIKAENDAKLEAEKKKTEEAENKLKKAKELEEKKQLEEKEEADRKTRLEEDAKIKKQLAPDKEKLAELVKTIDTIKFPAVEGKEAGDIIREANQMLDKVSKFIREKAKGL